MHVDRQHDGTRRLAEIAVLRGGEDGTVQAATVWHAEHGLGPDAAGLVRLLRSRGVG